MINNQLGGHNNMINNQVGGHLCWS